MTRPKIKGQSPEQPLPSTPKKGKKAVPVGKALELQPGESTSDANAAIAKNLNVATTSTAIQCQADQNNADTQIDDDAKSFKSVKSNVTVKSKAKSTTSSTRRLELEAELEALNELEKIELEVLQKKKEAVLKRLGLKKQIANEVDDDNDSQGGVATAFKKPCDRQQQLNSPSLPELCPFDQSLPNFPSPPVDVPPVSRTAVLDNWFNKMPSVPVEHPYAATQEVHDMNSKMEKFMARQSVSKDLPTFSGEPEQWFAFYHTFEHTTKLCGLTDHENLARLNKSLTGRARDAVISILTMPSNVPLVMDTLKMLFGRPNQIIKSMVEKTRMLPNIVENRPESIIAFANAVTNLVATMQSLQYTGHMNNPTLMEELLCKLPSSLQLQWCMAKPEGEDSLELFAKWLMRVAMAATSMPSTSSSRPEKSQPNDFRGFKKPVLTTQSNSTVRSCPKCHATDHPLYKCRSFLADSVDVRWDLVSKSKLCFSCLRGGHQTNKCNSRRECGVHGCKKPHHALLHRENAPAQGHTNFCGTGKEILLRILPVVLSGPNGKLSVFALLDEGSTVTMLDNTVAEKLGLEGEKQSLCLQWTNKMMQSEQDSRVVSCGICGVEIGSKQFKLRNVRTISSFALPHQSLNVPALKQTWPHLTDIPFSSLENAQPSLLIGQDNILLTTPRQVRHAGWSDPVATKTWLGWVIHGAANLRNRIDSVLLHHVCDHENSIVNDDSKLNEIVSRSFEVEAFATNLPAESMSTDEAIGLKILEHTVQRVGDHFEAGLLWRNENVTLPNSKTTALKRLWCMQRKMDRDPNFAKLYHAKIEEYLTKGYAFKLTTEEANKEGPRTFYIPHFATTNINKPGKIRMVFDAAAKNNGVSLNDVLVAGPTLLNDLPSVLWRFREHRIGFIADVTDMFHRVKIRDEDLDAQRFLWRGKNQKHPDVYVMKAMIFGATCSPSTAIFVMNKNAQEFNEEFPGIAEAVQKQYYVDDYVDSADDNDEATKKILDMIEVQRRGGFKLCNWICSSPPVLLQIPHELRANNWKDLQLDSRMPTERVLGLWWDPETDSFTFKLNDLKLDLIAKSKSQMTKRSLLKLIASLFDPLGILAHFVIKARIIFQKVWRENISWDQEIPSEQMKSWIKWCDQLPKITAVAVPRYYLVPPDSSCGPELHIFADASQEAYAVVAYFRWGEEDAIVSFIYGKSRVAPLKTLTIPRLELTAALLAARLAKKIKIEHNYAISSTFFWSDSRIALAWVRSGGTRYKQYVSNRVNEILEITNADQWKWVPTAENPADDGTRLNHVADLSADSRWYRGPNFLRHHNSAWPVERPISATTEEERPLWHFVGVIREEPSEILPDLKRFSSWVKLIRATTAWAFRFIKNIRCPSKKWLEDLLVFEIDSAEKRWIRKIQSESFCEEINSLWSRNPVPTTSRLYTLHPILDDENILRVVGRTEYSDLLSYNTKHPIILDGKHPYTRLLIQYYHVAAMHQGIETVMNNLRQKYWITQMKCSVKAVFRSCQLCKILHAKPKMPEMAPLPNCRVNSNFIAFDQVGIDLFGPIEVKVNKRKTEKRYGVIFTCLTIRAVHLEVASSLSTDATIMALRRFMNRRTVTPSDIYTDNGTNFRGASKEIRAVIRELQRSPPGTIAPLKPINWHFNPPSSPHMGGAWERLVRSVKTAMRAALPGRHPTDEILITTFTEVEYVLNNRPLTEVSVDPSDLRSLTPNDFLRIGSDPVSNWNINGAPDLKKHWRRAQVIADMFWRRWVKEYLPSLTRRQKWHKTIPTLKVGDAVLIADSNSPRNLWPKGIVIRVHTGRDGQVRSADVRTTNGTYPRPVVKLAVLDLEPEEQNK